MSQIQDYYARRAPEYESIYAKPERQADLQALRAAVARELAGHHVLELACGTGYWTQVIAEAAASVVATDATPEVLEVARRKELPGDQVSFREMDAFNLPAPLNGFSAVFAGFWWSHIPRERIAGFLSSLHAAVEPDVRVVFIDNRFQPGSSTPISRTDAEDNTYQMRSLSDGSETEVLKNFPDAEELRTAAEPFSRDIQVTEFEYFWLLSYMTGKGV